MLTNCRGGEEPVHDKRFLQESRRRFRSDGRDATQRFRGSHAVEKGPGHETADARRQSRALRSLNQQGFY